MQRIAQGRNMRMKAVVCHKPGLLAVLLVAATSGLTSKV